jgi:phosphatidylglycerophosphate synthase
LQTNGRALRVVILADESANWRIAGLRQIERIIFALEEFAARMADGPVSATVVWDERLNSSERKMPERRYSSALALTETVGSTTGEQAHDALVLTTRVVLARGSIHHVVPGTDAAAAQTLSERSDIPAAEKWLLDSLGKPQDGWVARHIHRPISTRITRLLLPTQIRPAQVTIGGFVFALAGCAALVRGDYASVLVGALLFYVLSILDGCDGEIARAKYLDSPAGQRLDLIFDTLANVLFLIALGLGLTRASAHSVFLVESIVAVLLILGTELMLNVPNGNQRHHALANEPGIYDRHAQMLGHSGAFAFNDKAVRLVVQLTKRDVAWLAFVTLAAVNRAPWILHLSGTVAVVTCGLSALAFIRRRPARRA